MAPGSNGLYVVRRLIDGSQSGKRGSVQSGGSECRKWVSHDMLDTRYVDADTVKHYECYV